MSLGGDVRTTKVTDGPSSTTRTTNYETRNIAYDTDISTYKAMVAPRHLVINRTMTSGPSSRSYSLERSSHYGSLGAPSGAYATVTSSGVNAVKSSREKEKKDMQDLNERFASYIEKSEVPGGSESKVGGRAGEVEGEMGQGNDPDQGDVSSGIGRSPKTA